MNLTYFLSRFKDTRLDYTEQAIALFGRFASRHRLAYQILEEPVEVMWEFPLQDKLMFPITLGLQNKDELNFGVPGFWSYFFPFPRVAETFEKCLDAWLIGEARIVRHPRFFTFTSSSTLEILTDGNWMPIYKAGGERWEHGSLVIQNVPQGSSRPDSGA